MGVHGLWPLLDRAGRPLADYSGLKGKRLAIDASIWMYQVGRAGHDEVNMELAIRFLFRRLAKLSHFGVKPVFVFDGLPPMLKREELRRRAESRERSEQGAKRIASKVLRTHLKMLASGVKPVPRKRKTEDGDLFKLKPMDGDGDVDGEDSEEEYLSESSDSDGDRNALLAAVDVDSAAFQALSEDLKLDILLQLKERLYRERSSLASSSDPTQFALSQLSALRRRQKITHALDSLTRGAGSGQSNKPQRIASSDSKAFVLVKDKTHGYAFQSSHNADEQERVAGGEAPAHSEDEFMRQFFGEGRAERCGESWVDAKPATNVDGDDKDGIWEKPAPDSLGIAPPPVSPVVVERPTARLPVNRVPPRVEKALEGSRDDDNPSRPARPAEGCVAKVEEFVDTVADLVARRRDDPGNRDTDDAALHEELRLLQHEQAKKLAASEPRSSDLERHFKALIDGFGFPWMVAIGEAEAQCAHLYATGVVDGIVTDDVDVFLFGGDCVYRWFFKPKVTPVVYHLAAEGALFTREDLVFLAVLIGGDYGPGVAGIGPKKAVGLLEQHKDKTLQDRVALCCGESALNARIIAAYLHPAVESIASAKYRSVDGKLLRAYLQRAGFKEHDIDRQLDSITKQTSI